MFSLLQDRRHMSQPPAAIHKSLIITVEPLSSAALIGINGCEAPGLRHVNAQFRAAVRVATSAIALSSGGLS
ncbi:hypothetical protein REMIM1_PB00121 (plasmid) [Rhizobium etli bv. mimosae str. Mim1]|nr:hypothetical protein REMIM1_PB00121 [Rhizobium etli bv. mimosae str. Mim1]